jgi:spore maturation protein CgeB
MKILMVAYMNPTTIDYPVYLADQWRAMGHEVENFSVDLEMIDEPVYGFLESIYTCFYPILERRIDAACGKFKPDIVLLMYNFLKTEAVKRLKRKHDCVVGSYLDHNYLLMEDTAPVLSLSDFVIVHDSYVTPIIQGRNWGRVEAVFYLAGLAEEKEHLPLNLSGEDRQRYGADIAFIGWKGPDRLAALPRLVKHGLRIWGLSDQWREIAELRSVVEEEPVYGLKKAKIYNAAKIVLSLEERTKQINSINPRISEALACGGFVLCNWTRDLEEAGFRDGENVAWFKSFDEMEEKAAHYLANPNERLEISRRGREHVLATLTYQKVAPDIARAMEKVLVARRSQRDKASSAA